MKLEFSYRIRILFITLIAATALIGLGIISSDIGIFGNMIIISVLITMAPQVILSYESYRGLKDVEANFPKLMMNLSESIRSGMPLHKAMMLVGKYDYGKLTPEVKKMVHQISWRTDIVKVLDQFADRVKKSKRLVVSIKTIKESYISGGDIASTLDHIAGNIEILGDVEKDRKSILNQYVILMYAISIIFVGIVSAINNFMIPVFEITSAQASVGTGQVNLGVSNPCRNVEGLSASICDNLFTPIASIFLENPLEDGILSLRAYYIALFFSMSLMQSVFSGLIAGVISEGSMLAGFKHSLIMAILVFGAFSIMVRIGFLG